MRSSGTDGPSAARGEVDDEGAWKWGSRGTMEWAREGRTRSPTIGLSVSRSVAAIVRGSSAPFGSRASRRLSGFLARTSDQVRSIVFRGAENLLERSRVFATT